MQALVAALVGVLGGTGGKVGWDKWRRNGKSGDADRIVAAICSEGRETRRIMLEQTKAISDLRVEVARQK